MRSDDLKQAFPKAPAEFHNSIEHAFERGEQEMKKRHKLMLSLSCAAVVLAICATVGSAVGSMLLPKPDHVVLNRGESDAPDAPEITEAIPTTEQTVPVDEIVDVVYMETDGSVIHSDPFCRDAGDVQPVRTQALTTAQRKSQCRTCHRHCLTAFITSGSSYVHMSPECSRMRAENRTIYNIGDLHALFDMGFTPCPNCRDTVKVYYTTEGNRWYHLDPECGGMKGASAITMNEAGSREACSVCIRSGAPKTVNLKRYFTLEGETAVHLSPVCGDVLGRTMHDLPELGDPSHITDMPEFCPDCCLTINGYYAEPDSPLYHLDPDCSGMSAAQLYSKEELNAMGRTPCPTCVFTEQPTRFLHYCFTEQDVRQWELRRK